MVFGKLSGSFLVDSGSFVCVLYRHYTNPLEKQKVIIMVYFSVFTPFSFFPTGWSEWLDWRTGICRKWGKSQCPFWNFGDKLWRRSWQRRPQGEAKYIHREAIFTGFLKPLLCFILKEMCLMADNMLLCIVKRSKKWEKSLERLDAH